MASYSLRPNADWNGASKFTGTGGADYAVLADDDDTTFLKRTDATIPASYETEFTTQAIPSDEALQYVTLYARMSTLSTDSLAQFSIGVITDRNGRTVNYSVPVSKQ